MMPSGMPVMPAVGALMQSVGSDAEFRHILVRVVIIGTVIIGVSTGILILFFRSFEKEVEGKGSFRPTLLMIVLIATIMVGCVVLLMISFVRR